MVIEFVFAAKISITNYANSKLLKFRGRGLSIISDRLKIIGARNEIKNIEGYTIDSIFIPL